MEINLFNEQKKSIGAQTQASPNFPHQGRQVLQLKAAPQKQLHVRSKAQALRQVNLITI